MSKPMVIEITARDNRLGWWGQLRHYRKEIYSFCPDFIVEALKLLADYETPVSITVDGRLAYKREVHRK